ncbi:RES family NAD+ phosphorylase [Acidothermaceae bacterium B102]|nr:RES family NAD+ phosphorylase [Acidothermaceae bacterium B102]
MHRHPWFRLDGQPPERWQWTPFPTPRYRFDSAAGLHRVRYAGDGERVAMRERFDASGRVVSPADLSLRLVEITGVLRVLDLRLERNLDVLGLDDQISTGRGPDVWATCQQLTDQIFTWYGDRCHGIVYRSRTTPQRSANIAFLANAPSVAIDRGSLGAQRGLLASCVLSDGFTVEEWPRAED